MKYTSMLTAEQISTLKAQGLIKNAVVTDERGFSERSDLVLMNGKVYERFYPKAHFQSVIVVDDNALVLTQSEAKKLRKQIEEQGSITKYDCFKQYTEDDMKRKDVQEWLNKLAQLKAGKLDKTAQAFMSEYNEWRSTQGYCRATSFILDEDEHICEAVEAHYSKDPVAVFQIANEVTF